MILLLGGTSETGPVANSLAEAGCDVLVSCATDTPLQAALHNRVTQRRGKLASEALLKLIREYDIKAVADVTHPYAVEVKKHAGHACEQTGIPYFRLERPSSFSSEDEHVRWAADHRAGARLAVSFSRPILLTVGTRNLEPYVSAASALGRPLFARVLPIRESINISLQAGIPEDRIIAARGPFSKEENAAVIRKYEIGVLVTKDSGEAGGVPAKSEAAREENCTVIVIERPPPDSPRNCCASINELIERCRTCRGGTNVQPDGSFTNLVDERFPAY